MALNLVEAVQSRLGYPPLHKVDPNSQEVIKDNKPVNLLAQAAIPSVLIEMYKVSINEAKAASLVRGNNSSSWVHDLFGTDYDAVVQKVADYGHTSPENAAAEIDKVANVSIDVIREHLKNADGKTIRNFFNSQVANLKKYLPGAMHMGEALHDETLDDRTNKMEGPLSNAMHAIERLFSDSGSQKKPFNPTDDTVHYK